MKSITSYKRVLISFVQVVLFLFLAFGGFLKKIAPPDETKTYYVGILSFLVLIALLIVSAIARRAPGPKNRRAWTIAGAVCFASAIPCALLYPQTLAKYTYGYPPENPTQVRVKGSDGDLTEDAKEWAKENPRDSTPGLLARKLPQDDVWTLESIQHAKTMLLVAYASLVLTLATAIFCLLEANADRR